MAKYSGIHVVQELDDEKNKPKSSLFHTILDKLK